MKNLFAALLAAEIRPVFGIVGTHELGIRWDVDSDQLHSVGVPAGANRRVLGNQPIVVQAQRFAKQLHLRIRDNKQINDADPDYVKDNMNDDSMASADKESNINNKDDVSMTNADPDSAKDNRENKQNREIL